MQRTIGDAPRVVKALNDLDKASGVCTLRGNDWRKTVGRGPGDGSGGWEQARNILGTCLELEGVVVV